MVGEFGDSPGKITVRREWNTPILSYLHEVYNIKYRYMGLPGVDLLDIKLWRSMISEIVAFEVPNEDDGVDERKNIIDLRTNLTRIGIDGKVYYGPMEEVILLGYDLDDVEYKQSKVVTLYNLDFCDEIFSKVETRDKNRKLLRFEALRAILTDQIRCYKENPNQTQFFILLLTIRNQFNAKTLKNHLDHNNLRADTARYLEKYGGFGAIPDSGAIVGTHDWALKAFIHNTLCLYFSAHNISSFFYPTVNYVGKSLRSPMLHSMVLCRFGDTQRSTPSNFPQNYLTTIPSVRAHDDETLSWELESGEEAKKDILISSTSDWLLQQAPNFLDGIKKPRRKVSISKTS